MLSSLEYGADPNVLYGADVGDDTGVYQVSEDLAIVQSLDYMTPIVDDPFLFGRIAAANSLSDIYTMAARPITALNIMSFPSKVGVEIIQEILKGGLDALKEAGVALLGGHSIEDKEPKYGLSVTGIVNPKDMVTSHNAKAGDVLILTKKIGTGILSNVAKLASGFQPVIKNKGKNIRKSVYREGEQSMARLNRYAAETMAKFRPITCTDVTGFGLLGHARSIAEKSNVSLDIEYSKVPVFEGVEQCSIAGTKGGGERNYNWVKPILQTHNTISHEKVMVLCDAQTSGGLLISCEETKSNKLLSAIIDAGDENAAIIGTVSGDKRGVIRINP